MEHAKKLKKKSALCFMVWT